MNINLNRNSGIPIYIQVKKQMLQLIKNGTLKVGMKIPTERELSQELGVSRNTISAAYNELESKGVLKSIRGKGTFIAEDIESWKNEDSNNKIKKFVDLAFEEALEYGLEPEDFLELVTNRVQEKTEMMGRLTAIFIECNIEQSIMFSNQLKQMTNMDTIPLTIDDLKKMDDDTRDKLNNSQVVVAPFNHVNDINNLLIGWNKEVLGVSINLNLELIVKIARHPYNTKFLFVCLSEEFMFKTKAMLEKSGLGDLSVEYFYHTDENDLKNAIYNADVLIATPAREKEVYNLNKYNKEVIKYSNILDMGSVKALKSKILEFKYQKN